METIKKLRGHIKPAASSLAVQMSGAPVWGDDAAQQVDHSTSCCRFYRAKNLSAHWNLAPLSKGAAKSSACTLTQNKLGGQYFCFILVFVLFFALLAYVWPMIRN